MMESFKAEQRREFADKAIRDDIDALTPRDWDTMSESASAN